MLNNIATKISSIIIQKCRLSSDLIKIYTYGCELLISTGLGMMSVFLISCLLGRPLSGIINTKTAATLDFSGVAAFLVTN